jgi:hypothetical protein
MFELNRQLDFFVQYKINTDPMYKRVSLLILTYLCVVGGGPLGLKCAR